MHPHPMEMYRHQHYHHPHHHQQGGGPSPGGRIPAAAARDSNASGDGGSNGNHHHNHTNGTKRPRSNVSMASASASASGSSNNYAPGNAAAYSCPHPQHPQHPQHQQQHMSYHHHHHHQQQQQPQPQQQQYYQQHYQNQPEYVYDRFRAQIQQQQQRLANQHQHEEHQQQQHQRQPYYNQQQQQQHPPQQQQQHHHQQQQAQHRQQHYHQQSNNRPQQHITGQSSSASLTASARTSATDFLLHIDETDPVFQLEADRKEAPTMMDNQSNNKNNNNVLQIQNSSTNPRLTHQQGGTHHRPQNLNGSGTRSSNSSTSTTIIRNGIHASPPAASAAGDTGPGGKSASPSSATTTASLNDNFMDVDDEEDGIDDAGIWDSHIDLEEQELLQRMLNDIQEDEKLNHSVQQPSKAQHVLDASSSGENVDIHEDCVSWKTKRRLKHPRGRESLAEEDDNDNSKNNKVSKVDVIQHVETNIPNRIEGTNVVLFTPAQFQTYVLNKVERTFNDKMDAGKEWAARIVENHPSNTRGYVLEARGPTPVLDILRKETQSFLDSVRARLAKKRIVANDEESLFVDVPVGRTEKPGIVFEEDSDTGDFAALSNGVWVKKFKSKKAVASALGMTRTKGREMLVTAINDTFVSSKKELTQAVQLARKDKNNEKYTITICLSKSFDLDSATGLSSLNARYRDGTVFDNELHRALKGQQAGGETLTDDEPCFLEYLPDYPFYERPSLPRKPPTSKNEVNDAFDEITSNENSVEVDLSLQANTKFGAIVHNCKDGVYLTEISPDGLIGTVLREEASKYGCVLLKVGCIKVQTKEDLEDPSLVADTPEGKLWLGVRVTIGLFDGTDLSQIDTNCLVRRTPNPRRSNKQPYALHPWPKDQANARDSSSESVPRKEKRFLNDEEDNSKEGDVLMEDDISELTGSDGDTVEIERKRGLKTSRGSDRPSKSSRLLTWSGSNDSSERSREDKKSKFDRFEKKYRDLSKLDFNDTKIHAKKRTSSLWSQHKKLVGEDADCGDSCGCVDHMAFLGSTVLTDHVGDSGQDLKKLRSLTCGIFEHFGPKFMPLLRIEYPLETPRQLASRLSDMWKYHRANRRFSSSCKEGCDCLGEWDGAFGKGDNEQAKKFSARPSRALLGAIRPSSDAPSIPRKKNPPPPPNAQSIQHMSTSGLLPDEARMQNPRNNHTHRNSSKVAVESFERRCDLTKPLGAYFFTFRAPSGQSRCRIASIYPNGQLAYGKPIWKHTSVVGYYVGNTVHGISTHEELRTQCDALRKQNKSLHLKLDTQGAKNEPAFLNLNDWDDNGKWIGNRRDGWDGSLPEASAQRKEPGAPLRQAQYETVVRDNDLPSPSAEPLKSIIKGKTDNDTNTLSSTKTKKILKFKDGDFMEEIYHFDMDSPTNVHVVKVTPSSVITHRETANGDHISHFQHAIDRFEDAVRNKTVKEVLEVLAGGACADRTVVEHGLNDAKEWAKKKKESPSCTPSERNDADAKLKLLKIYLAGSFAVFESLRVTKWHRVDMQIKELELKSEEFNQYENKHISGKVFQHVSKGDGEPEIQQVAKLDRRSQAEFISYDEGFCCFRVYNNLSVTYDERKIKIELEQQFPARTIGSVVFDVDEIESGCPKDGQKHMFKRSVQPRGGGPVRSGSLTLEARKGKPEKEYLEKKRKEAEKRLEKVVEDIKRFNDEYRNTLQISGNLRGLDEYSLLHAAVSLGNNSGLIDDLLSLGADPKHKSCDSVTPIKIASSHFEKASEYKVRSSENIGNLEEDEKEREKHHNQKCQLAKSIFEKLRNYHPRLRSTGQAQHNRHSQPGSITVVESRPHAGHQRHQNAATNHGPAPLARGHVAHEPPERREHRQRSGPDVGRGRGQRRSFGGRGNRGNGGLPEANGSTADGNRQDSPQICWMIRDHGWCRYGEKCWNFHPREYGPPDPAAGPQGGGRGSSHGGRGGGRGGRGRGRGHGGGRGRGRGSYASLPESSHHYGPSR